MPTVDDDPVPAGPVLVLAGEDPGEEEAVPVRWRRGGRGADPVLFHLLADQPRM